ncbi:MAG: caspase family protein [Deltaproteobacteria bacterium]|nr:caspase family protein [Deltaproteobacteria bacterium]
MALFPSPSMTRTRRALVPAVATSCLIALAPLAPAGCNRSSTQQPEVTDEPPAPRAPPVEPTRPSEAPPPPLTASTKGLLLPPERTHAVIAGVLSWPDPGLGAFSTRARKDLELAKLLQRRGVPPDRITLLLDAQATTKGIMEAVTATARQAGPGTTLLFYYAGHGVRGNDGKAYFASQDMRSRAPAQTGLSLDQLAHTIAVHFTGKRVVLMADCCYSGALKGVAEVLSNKGVTAVSVTSADAANTSTKNWTFTQAVIDSLSGDALCDADADGTITLEELSTEVRAAMLYREGQRYGFYRGGATPGTVITQASGGAAGRGTLPRDRRHYVEVQTPKGWQVARVRGTTGDQLTVRTYDYSLSTDHQVARAQTRPIKFRRYPVGAAIDVYWGKKIWPAKVERADGSFHFISYPGWPPYWNEWITSRRIVGAAPAKGAIAKDAAVMVEWRGDWWPAQVLERKGNRYLIHYDGYEANWDEWVGPDRIRKR